VPIDVKCSHCDGKFRVPDKFAGKRAKCPKCQGSIAIPAGKQPAAETPKAQAAKVAKEPGATKRAATPQQAQRSTPQKKEPKRHPPAKKPSPEEWYLQTEDGQQYGPISREELDEWVAEGRVDTECQILREGWDQWRWAEDVYPELAESAAQVPEVSKEPQIHSPPPPVPSSAAENLFAGIGKPPPSVVPPLPKADTSPPLSSGAPGGAASGQATGEATVGSTEIRRTLADILRPWLTFMGVMGFIQGAFLMYVLIRLIVGLFKALSMASRFGDHAPWQAVVIVISVFALIGAVVLYVIAAAFLLAFQQKMNAFLRFDVRYELKRAMTNYKQFWLFMFLASGIVVTVFLIFIILAEGMLL